MQTRDIYDIIERETSTRTMWNIIGHQAVCSYLDASINEERLHHAYLFVGEKHLGKSTVAKAFAKTVLNIPLNKEYHPDLMILTEEGKERDSTRDMFLALARMEQDERTKAMEMINKTFQKEKVN